MPGASQRPSRPAALVAAMLVVSTLAGCDRRPEPARVDSTPAPAPAPAAPAPAPEPATSSWAAEAGTALLVPGAQGEALVVVPGLSDGVVTDTSVGRVDAVLPAEVSLFTRGGAAGQARAVLGRVADPSDACTAWPTARLGPSSGADAVPRWTVGLVGGHAAPLPLDSLEALSSADSAALTVALARAAAGLPGDTARRLRGLPFAVRSARRFVPEPEVEAVVAVVARALNQEATPLGERVLLVAERPRGSEGPFTVAYHERVVGTEETIESLEVLAAVRLGADPSAGRPTLVLSREYYEGSAFTLLVREGAGRWRVRWTSAYRGC